MPETIKVALAQMAPVWLDRKATLEKIESFTEKAAAQGVELVVFGEALLPGYPFWTERTDGAKFNSDVQKELHALYMQQAVQPERGDLDKLSQLCSERRIGVITGSVEAALNRGGHSLYCTLLHIDNHGKLINSHRKLMPTYEERLSWAPGDGHGLRTHPVGPFTLGALNCWENWMPLARASLYGMGEDLHVAIWPGSKRLTRDITRFMALEGRSFVVSVSGLMGRRHIPDHIPFASAIRENSGEWLADGGSCVAGPDGNWLLEPQCETEDIFIVELDHKQVRRERQNFDPSGHYARPDVLQLRINRERQSVIQIEEQD